MKIETGVTMKIFPIALTTFGLLAATPSYAEKPAWAGQDKQTKEQVQSGMDEASQKAQHQHREQVKKAKGEKSQHQHQAREKMGEAEAEMKQEGPQKTERKEMGKGSEQGQSKREEKSKKWWKFWE
jgi:hypothetical protein